MASQLKPQHQHQRQVLKLLQLLPQLQLLKVQLLLQLPKVQPQPKLLLQLKLPLQPLKPQLQLLKAQLQQKLSSTSIDWLFSGAFVIHEGSFFWVPCRLPDTKACLGKAARNQTGDKRSLLEDWFHRRRL